MPPDPLRAALARQALAEIPKLLTLLDRTPVSPTYGCFDRSYWHYRIMDFPCGMSQEFVLPLALVWSLDLPDNPYRGSEAIRAWIEAGMRFAARSAHPDGSCDDYYPYERATGAAAFSLFAILEAARIIGLGRDAEIDAFLVRRAKWLAAHRESGQLSNHEALIVLCLQGVAERLGGSDFEAAIRERLTRLLSWQSAEGWFSEYGGADPGYLSLTIGLLAELDRRRPELGLRPPLSRAITFFAEFVHPDGTVGGEYTSRATLNFFPHGFEVAGAWLPQALAVNNTALRPLAEGRAPTYSDDRIIGHHLWNWLMTWRDYRAERPVVGLQPGEGRQWFPEAGLLIDRRNGLALFAALRRGGAFKLFGDGALIVSDTGPSLRVAERVAVSHMESESSPAPGDAAIAVEGQMAFAKSARLTPFRTIVLRSFMLVFGRFFPDLVRRLLQRLLVTGRKEAPFRFRRILEPTPQGWSVRDEISADEDWSSVTAAGIGGFQTSATTVMARVYRQEQLQPWLDLEGEVKALKRGEPLIVERRFGRP
jgi:hypothetical protein